MKVKPINPIARIVAYAREKYVTKTIPSKKGKGSYDKRARNKGKQEIQNEVKKDLQN